MVKPAAGYRPLAYSSPEPVQTTGTVAGDAGLVGSQTSERRLLALQDGFGKAIVLPRLKVE